MEQLLINYCSSSAIAMECLHETSISLIKLEPPRGVALENQNLHLMMLFCGRLIDFMLPDSHLYIWNADFIMSQP